MADKSKIEWTDSLVHTIFPYGSDARRCRKDSREEGWPPSS